jgi:hypothetical protein
MNKFELKIQNPYVLTINKNGNFLIDSKEDFPLDPGAVFGQERYGFTLIVDKKDLFSKTTYATQCAIKAMQMKKGILTIYEDHKYVPWRFDENGTLLNKAVFLEQSRRDTNYLADKGVIDHKEIEKINNY